MTTFRFTLAPGRAIHDQVVFAATKAILSGEMQPGDPFPSVRALAAELKINPNTAAKVVQHLVQEGWLVTAPGKGAVVATPPKAREAERDQVLNEQAEQLAVEGRRVGLTLPEITKAVAAHWAKLDGGSSEQS